MSGVERAPGERRSFFRACGHDSRDEIGRLDDVVQHADATRKGFVHQRGAIQVERVEEERRNRQRRRQRASIELPPEAPHRDLERLRPAVGPQDDGFAVEQDVACRHRAHDLDHFRHRDCHIPEVARIHANLVADLVRLDAGAVELVLERGFAQIGQRGANVGGRVGEHRLDRLERLQDESLQGRLALTEGGAGDRCDRAGEHRRPAYLRRGQAGRPRDRVNQNAFERPLPDFAEQQSRDEILLVARRPPEQIAQQFGAGTRRAGPGGRAPADRKRRPRLTHPGLRRRRAPRRAATRAAPSRRSISPGAARQSESRRRRGRGRGVFESAVRQGVVSCRAGPTLPRPHSRPPPDRQGARRSLLRCYSPARGAACSSCSHQRSTVPFASPGGTSAAGARAPGRP